MIISQSPVLRLREDADLSALVSWVPDAEALYQFAGSSLSWPLSRQQLAATGQADGRSSWVLVNPSRHSIPLAHADLTVSGDRARIGRVIVDPVHRGRGIGTALVRELIDVARHRRCRRLDLLVIDGNVAALRTYGALAFLRTPTADVDGMLAMTLDLGSR